MKDGTVGWNPGKFNPNIIRPAGPIDLEVGIVYCETAQKKPFLTYSLFYMTLHSFIGFVRLIGVIFFRQDEPYG
jgi:neutral ceramidase